MRRLDLEARDEAVVGLTTSEVSRPAIRPPYELDDLWEADHDSNEVSTEADRTSDVSC